MSRTRALGRHHYRVEREREEREGGKRGREGKREKGGEGGEAVHVGMQTPLVHSICTNKILHP